MSHTQPPRSEGGTVSRRIPSGAAVRDIATGRLGRTFCNADGNIRGHLFVKWDGDRGRKTVRLSDVMLVANKYDAAKVWEVAEAAGDVRRTASWSGATGRAKATRIGGWTA
jgi:hypothetical protein